MNDKFMELIDKLEALSPEIWEIMLRQQHVEGWISTLIFVLSLLTIIYPFKWVMYEGDDDAIPMLMMATLFVLLTGGFFLAIGLTHLINPEFYAIEALLGRP